MKKDIKVEKISVNSLNALLELGFSVTIITPPKKLISTKKIKHKTEYVQKLSRIIRTSKPVAPPDVCHKNHVKEDL